MITWNVNSIVTRNSINFVEHVFSHYDRSILFAIDRTGTLLSDFQSLIIQNIIIPNQDQGWLAIHHELVDSDQPAQIVFTSGTEGKPKAILLSYRNLANVIRRLNNVMEVDSSIREYIGVPVHYSFGLGRCRAVAAVGGAFYIPPNGFNPLEIRQMLQRGEINAISAVPSLWRILLESADILGDLGRHVRWIEIGSQYMAANEKQQMKQLFPAAKIIQHYGLTEASRSTFLDISTTSGELLESVGCCAVAGVGVKISENGNIRIKGEHVALGKLRETGELASLTDEEGWLETKDLGEIRQGSLFYLGRSDDQVNIGGIKISPEKLEQEVALQFHCPGQIAVAGARDRLRGMKLLVAYRSEIAGQAGEIEQFIQNSLQKHGIQPGGNFALLQLEEFPLTETGKIQRAKFAALYDSRALTSSSVQSTGGINLSDTEEAIASLWREVLGAQYQIKSNDSFLDLGGDSLSSLRVIIKMEKKGYGQGAIQAMMHGRPLSVIASTISGIIQHDELNVNTGRLPRDAVLTWSLNALRGLMVSIVLLGHWGPGVWSRLFGDHGEAVDALLNPVYRMGTPGFAIVFGIGVGYYFITNTNARIADFGKRIKPIFMLVFFAWLFLGGLHLVERIIEGVRVTGLLIGNSLYSILCYYVLAIASIPIWRHWINIFKHHTVYAAVLTSFLFWIFHLIISASLPSVQLNSILELPRLMLTAKYGYFRIGTAVFFGVAIGCLLRQGRAIDETAHKLIWNGLGLFFSGLFVTLDVTTWKQLTHMDIVPLPMIFLYLGTVGLLLGGGMLLVNIKNTLPRVVGVFINLFIVLGVLALPIYVFHETVIPAKDILIKLGVTSDLSLALPMACFLIIFFGAGIKIYKLYFSRGKSKRYFEI